MSLENIERLMNASAQQASKLYGNKPNLGIPLKKTKISHEVATSYKSDVIEDHQKFSVLIDKTFGHFELNQNDDNKSYNILNNYCFSGYVPEYLKDEGFVIPNENSDKMNDFYIEIENWIKRFFKVTSKDEVNQKFRFIVGPKGCGKTTFINYFLTLKHQELNNQKIVPLRINAMELTPPDNLQRSLKAKKCKILLNHYGENNKNGFDFNFDFENVYANLLTINSKTYSNCKINLESEYLNFVSYFDSNANRYKHPLFSDNFNFAYQAFKDYIYYREPDIKFLYILDNFDRLSLGMDSNETFENAIKQLEGLMLDDDKNGGTYLVITRYNTFLRLKSLTNSLSPTYALKIADLSSIVQKRIQNFTVNNNEERELLFNYVRLVGSGITYIDDNEFRYPVLTLDESINNIFSFANEDRRIVLDILKTFKNDFIRDRNLERLITILTLIKDKDIQYEDGLYEDENQLFKSLSGKIEWGSYPKRERLLINSAGWADCMYFYETKRETTKICHRNESDSHHKFEVLPNLFTFPFIPETVGRSQFIPLLKIRIIQSLINLVDANDSGATISEFELLDYFFINFKYEKDVVLLAIDELIFSEIIRKGNDSSWGEGYTITDRGRFIFNNFTHRLNYICICIEAVGLPTTILKKNESICFPIANYGDTMNYVLYNKFISTAIFIGILIEIEKKEESYFNEISKTAQAKYHNEKDFSFVRMKIQNNVKQGWKKILNVFSHQHPNFKHKLDNTINELLPLFHID